MKRPKRRSLKRYDRTGRGTLVVCGCWEGIVTLEMVSSYRVYGKLKDLGIGSLGRLKMFSCHPHFCDLPGGEHPEFFGSCGFLRWLCFGLNFQVQVGFSVGNRQAIHVFPEKRDWFLKRGGLGFPKKTQKQQFGRSPCNARSWKDQKSWMETWRNPRKKLIWFFHIVSWNMFQICMFLPFQEILEYQQTIQDRLNRLGASSTMRKTDDPSETWVWRTPQHAWGEGWGLPSLKPTKNQWLEGEITFGMTYVEAKMSVSGTVWWYNY